jgi:TRAP transporter TAXI family solute receptor
MWRRKLLLLASLALVAHRALCQDSNDSVPIGNEGCPLGHTLLTGTRSGYYYKVGKALEVVAEEQCKKAPGSPCLRICAKENPQTLNNIQKLANKQVDFAIVQGDVAHDAWYGHRLPLGKHLPGGQTENIAIEGVEDVKLVTPLYVEAVHVLLRPHLNITKLEELRGLKVWLGLPGSSTEYTAKRVLGGAGFRLGECEPVGRTEDETDALVVTCITDTQDFSSVVDQLKPGGLDALFKIGPVPTSDLEGVLLADSAGPDQKHPKKSDYQLLPVDYDLARKFVQDHSYVYRLIQKPDYKQGQSTLTIGVPALLLTNLKANNEDVAQLAQLVREKRKQIEDLVAECLAEEKSKEGLAEEKSAECFAEEKSTERLTKEKSTKGEQQKLSLDLLNVAVPVNPSFVHEKAKLYQLWTDWASHITLVAVVAGFVVLCFLVAWLGKMTRKQFFIAALTGHSLVISSLLLALACGVGACWLKQDEASVNEAFRSFPVSVWSTIRLALPFWQSPIITPQGELHGSVIAWVIRLLTAFVFAHALKEKLGPALKKWQSASETVGRQDRRGAF